MVVGLGYATKDFNSTTNEFGTFNYISGDVKFYLKILFVGAILAMLDDKRVFLSGPLISEKKQKTINEVTHMVLLGNNMFTIK